MPYETTLESTLVDVTEREVRVLRLIADGYSNAEIARRLGWSQHTVKNVIYDLMARLRLRNRTHVAAYAVRAGLA
jgi:DNA-binding NarL/FixJ family response regulator